MIFSNSMVKHKQLCNLEIDMNAKPDQNCSLTKFHDLLTVKDRKFWTGLISRLQINFCYCHSLINTLDISVIRYGLVYTIFNPTPPLTTRIFGETFSFSRTEKHFLCRKNMPVRSFICSNVT